MIAPILWKGEGRSVEDRPADAVARRTALALDKTDASLVHLEGESTVIHYSVLGSDDEATK